MVMVCTFGSFAWIIPAICSRRSAESTKASPFSRKTRVALGQRRAASSMSASTCSVGQTANGVSRYMVQKAHLLWLHPTVTCSSREFASKGGR